MRMLKSRIKITATVLLLAFLLFGCEKSSRSSGGGNLSPAEAQSIAKEAYIYGYPMVDHYKVMFAYYLYPNNPEYKGAMDTMYNTARVFTPDDKAI
jgi:hypothetical protein